MDGFAPAECGRSDGVVLLFGASLRRGFEDIDEHVAQPPSSIVAGGAFSVLGHRTSDAIH